MDEQFVLQLRHPRQQCSMYCRDMQLRVATTDIQKRDKISKQALALDKAMSDVAARLQETAEWVSTLEFMLYRQV